MAHSILTKIIASRSNLIYLITAKDYTQRPAYYYLLVDKEKQEALDEVLKSGSLELTDFGRIIASGYGTEPSEEIKRKLKEVYNFDSEPA